jgi:heme/copper-type cytochrome/quinol oxidase subunit 3
MSAVADPVFIPRARRKRQPIAPSGVIGMLVFIVAELMFFAGLLSAFTITRATAVMAIWPPPGQPRLPAEDTLINTAALVLSGVVLAFGHWRHKKAPRAITLPLVATLALGGAFVALQGVEWVAMIRQGLTLQSGAHGAFFYLIVGAHGLHAIGALIALAWLLARAMRGRMKASELYTVEVFWYFVVLLWPVIYARVYF